jgi:hypothetical protein
MTVTGRWNIGPEQGLQHDEKGVASLAVSRENPGVHLSRWTAQVAAEYLDMAY